MFKTTIASILTTFLALFLAYQFVPLSWFEVGTSPNFRATITTIQGSDTLKDSRAVINTNFSNLNTGKFELSDWYATTTARQLTTLESLVTVGTIGSGIWQGTEVGGAYGGTGSTTLSLNAVMLGNTTSGLKTVAGMGSSGQFLTSNGVGSAPTWQSSTVNQTTDYTWTGHHIFSTLFATNATATNATTTNGFAMTSTARTFQWGNLFYAPPAAHSASSSVLTNNGSGDTIWSPISGISMRGFFLAASTTDTTISDSATETTFGNSTLATLPGGVMGTNGALRIRMWMSAVDSGGNSIVTIRVKLGGTTVCTLTNITMRAAAVEGFVDFLLFSDGSASAQQCTGGATLVTSGLTTGASIIYSESTSTVDTSADKAITITSQQGEDGGDTETTTIKGVQAEFLGRI